MCVSKAAQHRKCIKFERGVASGEPIKKGQATTINTQIMFVSFRAKIDKTTLCAETAAAIFIRNNFIILSTHYYNMNDLITIFLLNLIGCIICVLLFRNNVNILASKCK